MEYIVHLMRGETQAVDDYERSRSPSLILIDFDIPALTRGLHLAETALEFSNNEFLFAVSRI
jgi:hypothetical protein